MIAVKSGVSLESPATASSTSVFLSTFQLHTHLYLQLYLQLPPSSVPMIIRHLVRRSLGFLSLNTKRQWQSYICSSFRLTSPPPPNLYRLPLAARGFASSRSADEVMDALQEMYATAKDEFEIAAEETERKTVYAADDREAAKEALGALKDAYHKTVRESSPEVAHEVQGRVGQRIRELENAVQAMEECAKED